ncbi:MAG: ribonuclease HII [Candidatus Wallbacteria bacterium]|nr:ribonuclease HII [Candidatus Wallbacteria bacterium]
MQVVPDITALPEKQIRKLLEEQGFPEALLEACRSDARAGVRGLARSEERRQAARRREDQRLKAMVSFERAHRARGFDAVAGVDEVGRGPLAGPVVAACVVLPFDEPIPGVDDSKKLSPERRERLDLEIRARASGVGIAEVDAAEIDRINILQASKRAMELAIHSCAPAQPDFLLIDAVKLPAVELPQLVLIHGDSRSYAIAAASIVAKVYRDRLMAGLDARYPHYGFAANKGYGTQEHMDALERLGPCEIHRRSFAPVTAYVLPSCRLYLEAIGRAGSLVTLRRAGLEIRANGSHLTASELEALRQAYRQRLQDLGGRFDSPSAAY